MAQFSGPPRSHEPREGRAGGRPYPVCPVCWGGATSVPYSGRERTQLVPGSAPRRRHNCGGTDADSTASLPPASNFSLNLAAPRRDAERLGFRAGLAPPRAPRPARSRGRTRRGWARPLPASRAASRTARARAPPPADPPLGPGPDHASPPLGAGDRREGGAAAGPGERRRLSARPKSRAGHERRAASAAFGAREGERAAQAPRELAAAPEVVAAGTGLPRSRAHLQPLGIGGPDPRPYRVSLRLPPSSRRAIL